MYYQIPCIRAVPFAFSAEIHKSDFLPSLAHRMYCHILNFCQSVRNGISFLVCVSLSVSEVELDFVEEPFLHLFKQPVYLLLLIFYQIFGLFFLAYKSSLCFKDVSSLLLIYISNISLICPLSLIYFAMQIFYFYNSQIYQPFLLLIQIFIPRLQMFYHVKEMSVKSHFEC